MEFSATRRKLDSNFHLQHIDPIPSMVVRERLEDEDLRECEKAILGLVSMESRNEQLPTISAGTRGKGPKRYVQVLLLITSGFSSSDINFNIILVFLGHLRMEMTL